MQPDDLWSREPKTLEARMAGVQPHDRTGHRTIFALDTEQSTSRPNEVKRELRHTLYELTDHALRAAGIHPRRRDRFIDRGDGILVLIHPLDQAPKALLLTRVVPALSQRLASYNANLPAPDRLQRHLRVRAVVHAGEVLYDANGCFGEALDVAFRLLDAAPVKKALREAVSPLTLVVSADIYNSVVRQGHRGIDQHDYRQLVQVQMAGIRHQGRIYLPGKPPPARWPAWSPTESPPDAWLEQLPDARDLDYPPDLDELAAGDVPIVSHSGPLAQRSARSKSQE